MFMNKQQREMKNKILAAAKIQTDAIFDVSKKAELFTYTTSCNEEIVEEPGKYNSVITKDMAYDMFRLYTVLYTEKEYEWAEKLLEWKKTLDIKDITVRRMIDDRKDERELSEYVFKDTDKTLSEMNIFEHSNVFKGAWMNSYKDKIKDWKRRFLKLDIMAFCIKSCDNIDGLIKLASMRAVDDNGNLTWGISEEDENVIRIMCAMEQILLSALIRLPEESNGASKCMEQIGNIEGFITALVTGKDEKFDIL